MADLMQQARAELAVTAQENMRKARALFNDNLIDAREVAGQFSDWLRVNAACQAEEFPKAAGQLSATAELIDRLAAALRAAPEGGVPERTMMALATGWRRHAASGGRGRAVLIQCAESLEAAVIASRPQGVK